MLEILIYGCHYLIEGSPKSDLYQINLKILRVPGTRGTRSNVAPDIRPESIIGRPGSEP